MSSVGMLVAASLAFVGTHFLLSHPFRAPLVSKLGEKGFAGFYSLVALLTLSGLASLIALARAGIGLFWAEEDRATPRVLMVEMAPVAGLLAICLGLTVAAGPAMRYLGDAAQALHAPRAYIEAVVP